MAKSLNEIEGLIVNYPEEVKQDVLDIYKYMLDKCQGNRKVLAANLQTLGVGKRLTYSNSFRAVGLKRVFSRRPSTQ